MNLKKLFFFSFGTNIAKVFGFFFLVHLHQPMVLLVVKPDPEEED